MEKVETYWTQRSSGYCKVNEEELKSFKHKAWAELIREFAPGPAGKKLKVLDVGTGPGFLALVMAKEGHEVTAVDYTPAMLEKARKNAETHGETICFKKMDAHNLNFRDKSFDLVITRNLTWNLEDPEKAYQEFFRVLNDSGRLLNFDANWYLHLHDPVKRRAYEQDRENAKIQNCPDHYTCTDTKAMEAIASELPLSRIIRPHWDKDILAGIGFKSITIQEDIKDRVWDRDEKINYGSTPMFMICAEK